MDRKRQILACSGVLYPPEDSPPEMVGAQLRQAMALAGTGRPKVCLIATAVGDSPAYLDQWYGIAEWYGPADLSHLTLFTQPNVPDVSEFHEALGVVPGRHAWHVAPDGAGRYRETAILARYWLPPR